MSRKMIAALVALVMSVSVVHAMDIGLFGSYWEPKDDDGLWGGGVLFLPSSIPLEVRGTYYESSSTHELEAIPVDVGLSFQFTQFEKVNVFAVGGGSYYILDHSDRDIDNEFGWYAGGRLELKGPKGNAIILEAFYRGIEIDDPDLDFSGWAFNAGISF